MKKKPILIVILLFLALTINAQDFDFKAGSFTVNEYFIELPYQNVNNKIIVEVEITGKKRRFLLDTGAPLAISQQLFDELKPTILTKQLISDINRKTDSLLFVNIDSLKIGDMLATGIPAVVLKNNPILDCLHLDGFIGSNVFRNSVLQFDSRKQVIRIANSVSELELNNLLGEDILLDQQATPFFKIKIGKKILEYVMFDSGSDVFYAMSHGKVKKFTKAKDFIITHKAVGSNQIGLYGLADSEESYLLRIPSAEINGVRIHNIIAETISNSNSRLGSSMLSYGVLTIDYKQKKYYYQGFSESNQYQSEEYQISPTFMNDKLCVGKIWLEELSQIMALGDEIISVNDVRVDTLTLCDAINGLIPKGGVQIKMTIKNKEGAIRTVAIERID